MTLGDYIKEYRMTHQCSMDDFARSSGLSKAYVSILERNYNPSTKKAAVPSLDTIKRVATATGIDFNDLLAALDGNQEVSLRLEKSESTTLPDNILPMPEMRKIPLLGTIACGAPILAEEHIEEHVDIPKHIHADFALRCKGDSMINARIFDGDIVYIRQQETVENGEIAAVLVDNDATLKRVKIYEDRIVLEPANPLHDPLVFRGEEMNDVHILGKAVAFTSTVR
jgi:repressor LexA